MKNISERNFKIMLDAVWSAYSKAVGLVNLFESVGLTVNRNDNSASSCLDLYGIQRIAVSTILKLWNIDEKKRKMRSVDKFLYDAYTYFHKGNTFPESLYPKLISMLMELGGCRPPWEENPDTGSGPIIEVEDVDGHTRYLQGISLPIKVNSIIDDGELRLSDVSEMHTADVDGVRTLIITPEIVG